MAPLDAEEKSTGDAYLDAWAAISRSMESGISWSGHEHNVAWLNACDGTFVEASAVAGFDQVEDGRVVCKTDWDRDGDMDLWLRSRNGVTLRYLENQSNPASFVEVTGLGRRTVLSIELVSGASGEDSSIIERVIPVPVTDGYLSAPTRRVTLALGPGESVAAIEGESVPASGRPVRRFDLAGGQVPELEESAVAVGSPGERGVLAESPLPMRTVLRSPLPLPPERLDALGVPHEREPAVPAARLLVVRSSECPTCRAVLPDALAELEKSEVPVQVIEFPVSMDLASVDPSRASTAAALCTILESVTGPAGSVELALPLSVLLDSTGAAHTIYQGDLDAGAVSQDATSFVLDPVKAAFRPAWGRPGRGSRWFHGAPRSFDSLRAALLSQGLDSDEHFFAAISARNR
ncbi:hypothetical protein Poly30_21860 [Planctomycetes bacterium Poly30]|uniref:Thioredoxin domain-containing protein n=1 Tax=Saltatorellus ferox TaxID=2528018 RepID=A0A518ERF3_9BACT|nr:hypothetical protein Poly30_21860 [Planctomycetes bacterium Poly30]